MRILYYDEIEEDEKADYPSLCLKRTRSFRNTVKLLPIMSTEIKSSKIYNLYMKGSDK